MAKITLFLALAVVAVTFVVFWLRDIARTRRAADPGEKGLAQWPTPAEHAIGFVTNFFDTLGIGSFATTTAAYKLRGLVNDRLVPGTLNVGHTIPVVIQAFIYTAIIDMDTRTLILLIGSSVLGAWLGAGVVAGWSRRKVQVGMGAALLVAAMLMLMTQLNLFPAGGNTLGLEGMRLAVGIVGNFMLGALMTLGIGLYAPCMILISLLGMNPKAAFPVMMGSCAFLMPVGSVRFIDKGSYSLRPALGLAIGGIPGVLIAAYLVKSLPLGVVRWLVVVVVVYTAIMMLRSASRERRLESSRHD